MVADHQKEEGYSFLYLLKGNIIMTKNDIKKDSAEETKDKKNEIYTPGFWKLIMIII